MLYVMMSKAQSYDSSIHKLTIEQKEYAARVLNESDENRENAMEEVKRWIEENDLRARTGKNNIMLEFLNNVQ